MNYIYIPIIDSTQNYIKNNLDILPDLTWVCSGFQTNGKGQFDRTWQSEDNKNVLCSVLLKKRQYVFSEHIQIKTSSIIIEILKSYGIEAYYKEPNDIYVSNKKICGILVETKVYEASMDIIIGIGLNVNQRDFDSLLQATSMMIELSMTLNLEDIIEEIKLKTKTLYV
jgi:biotin transport system substrate-specific component/BirA family biotin operon repressor/biotin-[acetyl-CoA-carboxylase] ligase